MFPRQLLPVGVISAMPVVHCWVYLGSRQKSMAPFKTERLFCTTLIKKYKYSHIFLSFSIIWDSYLFLPLIKSIYKRPAVWKNYKTFSHSAYWHSSHDQVLMYTIGNSYVSWKFIYSEVSRMEFVCPEVKSYCSNLLWDWSVMSNKFRPSGDSNILWDKQYLPKGLLLVTISQACSLSLSH